MSVYNQIPVDTFDHIVANSGMVMTDFDPETGTVNKSKILGPTTGTVSVNVQRDYNDWGEDINGCPKNTKELMRTNDVTITASGTFVALTKEAAQKLMAHADISGNKITPRLDIDIENDFFTIWIVTDYSSINTGTGAGRCAMCLKDVLSTGGFQYQGEDKGKAQFAFEFTAHFSLDAQDTIPFELYLIDGVKSSSTPSA